MIRVMVVDDHPAVRLSMAAFLEAQDDIDVVGEGENGREAVELSGTLGPDLVLMDIRMPVLDGIQATRLIKAARPEVRVVLITAYEHDELAEAGRLAGADAFLLKGVGGAELCARVRAAAA